MSGAKRGNWVFERSLERMGVATGILLNLKELQVRYGDIPVLWEISLQVQRREIVGLLGGNGAGKTTMLNAISGMILPTKGVIHFLDDDITKWSPTKRVQRGITQIPEGRQLFSGLSVLQNLRMGAFARNNKSNLGEDLNQIFDLFPVLKERKDQLAGTLSGGEQQMCAIGRGLMARPKLLLIDELSLGLAPLIVDRIIEALRRVHEKGDLSMLLVEQDAQLGLEVSDRVYVLENGCIAKVGRSQDLAEDPEILRAYLGVEGI